MKKCLIVSTVSRQFTLFERGNIEVLKELGYEVHCVANYSDATNELKELGIIEHNIDIQRSPFSLKNIKAYKQLKTIIDSDDYDLIHCHSPMGGVLARLAAKKTRRTNHTRVIYTAHGFHFFKGAPLINWMLYYPVEKFLSRYTDCIITINSEDYNIANKKFKAKEVKLVNGIGVDENRFNFEMSETERHDLRRSLGIKDNDFVIIYVAELSKRKNQGMLIKAIKEVINEGNDNIKVLLAGKDSLNGKYQKIVERYNMQENVKFLGFRNDIPQLMKISNLCVSTSKQEGLPVNIMEAMLCGIPIIATDCRGNRDLIQNGINGYIIKINDVEELANKITVAIQNRDTIKNDMNEYCLEIVKTKMKEVYKNLFQKTVFMLRSTSIKNDSRIMKEAKVLCDANYKIKILGWDRDKFLEKNTEFIECKNKTILLQVFKRKASYASGMKSIFKLLSFQIWLLIKLFKKRKKIDIIHACDFDTAIPARIISKLYNKKLVYDIFDYYIDSHYVPNKLKGIVEKAEIGVINSADLTIICTEQRKEQISRANPKKCIVIYNTPDIENYNSDKRIIKSSNNNRIKLVYVGILQENRLLKEIGDLIKEHVEIELHIGGFGTYEQYFQELSRQCSNVFYYGKMKYEDTLCLEIDCDILFATYSPIIENHKYSAPNKLYETMALGKTIIVCKGTGIDKIVEEEKIGYSISYDAKEFIESIEKLKGNEQLRKQFNDNAHKIYCKKYSWKQMEKRLLEEYKLL